MSKIQTKKTNSGLEGGNLVGKPHENKSGKSVGGIKAVVTDNNGQPVELEGGEVIINKEASKRHWKELSRINQSAGNGVAIGPPVDPHEADPDEYKTGGKIDFNPNQIPNKWILKYAENIKANHPDVWDLGGNIFGNEAFTNLKRVAERGYWLDSEKWMMIKWRSYVARHKKDFRIAGVIAMLKWVDKVDKGWPYMKKLIEAEIEKKKGNKQRAKNKKKLGGFLDSADYQNISHPDDYDQRYHILLYDKSYDKSKIVAKTNETSSINKTIGNLKITPAEKQRLYVYDSKERREHSEWEPENYDKGGKMSEPDKTYMFSKSGSKAMPIIVIEANDGSHQIDMRFDSLTEAKKFAEKHNIKMQKEGGYNMPKKLAKGDTIEINEDGSNLPGPLYDLFGDFDEDEDPYEEMERLKIKANEIGYDFDYGLSGEPTEFWEVDKMSGGGKISDIDSYDLEKIIMDSKTIKDEIYEDVEAGNIEKKDADKAYKRFMDIKSKLKGKIKVGEFYDHKELGEFIEWYDNEYDETKYPYLYNAYPGGDGWMVVMSKVELSGAEQLDEPTDDERFDYEIDEMSGGGQTQYFGASDEDEKKAGQATDSYYSNQSFTGGYSGTGTSMFKNGNAFKTQLKKYYLPNVKKLLKNTSKASVRITALSKSSLVFKTTGEFSKVKIEKTFEKINENKKHTFKDVELQPSKITNKEFCLDLVDRLKQGGQVKGMQWFPDLKSKNVFINKIKERFNVEPITDGVVRKGRFTQHEIHSYKHPKTNEKLGQLCVDGKHTYIAIANFKEGGQTKSYIETKKMNTGGNVTDAGDTYEVGDKGRWNGNKVLDIVIGKITGSSVFFWDDTNSKEVRKKKVDFNKLYVPDGKMLPGKTKKSPTRSSVSTTSTSTTPTGPGKTLDSVLSYYQDYFKGVTLSCVRNGNAKNKFFVDEDDYTIRITRHTTKSFGVYFIDSEGQEQGYRYNNAQFKEVAEKFEKDNAWTLSPRGGKIFLSSNGLQAMADEVKKLRESLGKKLFNRVWESQERMSGVAIADGDKFVVSGLTLSVNGLQLSLTNILDSVKFHFDVNYSEAKGINNDLDDYQSSGPLNKRTRFYITSVKFVLFEVKGQATKEPEPTHEPEPTAKPEPRVPMPTLKTEPFNKKTDYLDAFKNYLSEDGKYNSRTLEDVAMETTANYLTTADKVPEQKTLREFFDKAKVKPKIVATVESTADLIEKQLASAELTKDSVFNVDDIAGSIKRLEMDPNELVKELKKRGYKKARYEDRSKAKTKTEPKTEPKAKPKPKTKAKPEPKAKAKAKVKKVDVDALKKEIKNSINIDWDFINEYQSSYISFYGETDDRGPRTDHGGGEDGDDWADEEQIEEWARPFRDKWYPRLDKLKADLTKKGYKVDRVGMEYGEKGHIGLEVSVKK